MHSGVRQTKYALVHKGYLWVNEPLLEVYVTRSTTSFLYKASSSLWVKVLTTINGFLMCLKLLGIPLNSLFP